MPATGSLRLDLYVCTCFRILEVNNSNGGIAKACLWLSFVAGSKVNADQVEDADNLQIATIILKSTK